MMSTDKPKKIVTIKTLNLYDKYGGDFGMLDERWASKKDRGSITEEECRTLGQWVDQYYFSKSEYLSPELREKTNTKLRELESDIEVVVIQILKERINKESLINDV